MTRFVDFVDRPRPALDPVARDRILPPLRRLRGRAGEGGGPPSRAALSGFQPRAGFTLIEVIVALVVSGIVAAAGYGVLAGVADGRAAVAREREAKLPGPAARGALDGWLRGAALWEGSGEFRGRDRRVGPLPLDELSFTVEDGGALYPGRRRVTLWIERDPNRPRHGLLAEIAPADRGGAVRTDTLSVAPRAAGLNVRYRTLVRMRDTWLDAWASDRLLPEAVEVTVLPAPQRMNDPAGDGLPDVLRLPLAVPLRPAPPRPEDGRAAF